MSKGKGKEDLGNRTIEFTAGIHPPTTRAYLKRGLEERFGGVDAMHMGNPQDQENEPAWVRFQSESTATRVMEAIERGEVSFNGHVLQARWRGGARAPPTNPGGVPTSRRDLDIDARDLLKEDRRGSKGGKGGKGRRDMEMSARDLMREDDRRKDSRSRSRRRKRSSSRDRKRDRDRDRDRRRRKDSRSNSRSRRKRSRSSSSEDKKEAKPHWSTKLAAKYFQHGSEPPQRDAQGQLLPPRLPPPPPPGPPPGQEAIADQY